MSNLDSALALRNLQPTQNYLVAIDSDGCAFDSMGIKQRECFCPWMIGCFGLQPVAAAARECKDFADLFSKTRGANRHKTLVRILTELLPSHPLTIERQFSVPQLPHYVRWVNDPKSLLSNDGLQQAIDASQDAQAKAELQQALNWSLKVNEAITEIVKGVPPFPHVPQALKKIVKQADIIVCSATPNEALEREWQEHHIAQYVKVIAGQEMGTKAQQLAIMAEGKYDKDKIIMIGDAPGDYQAAQRNGVLYYPINPGAEPQSWQRFCEEGFDKFIAGQYAGDYQRQVVQEFDSYLPTLPPWSK